VDERDLVKKPAGEVKRYDRDFLLRFSQVHSKACALSRCDNDSGTSAPYDPLAPSGDTA